MRCPNKRWWPGAAALLAAVGLVARPAPAGDARGGAGAAALLKDRFGDPLPTGALARLGTLRFRPLGLTAVRALAYSPDGKLLASGCTSRGVCLWDAESGRCTSAPWGDDYPRRGGTGHGAYAIAFSPDGKRLAAAWINDAKVRVWDLVGGKEVHRLELRERPGNGLPGSALAFSHDSKHLACGDAGGVVSV